MASSIRKTYEVLKNVPIVNGLAGTMLETASRANNLLHNRSVLLHRQLSSVAHRPLHTWKLQVLVGIFIFGLWSASGFADDRIYCYQNVLEPGATGGGKIRVNGFTVEVKPTPGDVQDYMMCHAKVTSPQGKVVYEKNEWGIEIDPVTGRDVNGDGQPDVVLVSFSGGAHCCWTYHIISLGKNPGLIREFENRSTASFKDLRQNGQIEILIRDGSFDEGFGLDHAFSVFPLLIVQLKGEEFIDVGSRHRAVFEKEIQQERGKFNPRQLQDFLHSNPNKIHDDLDYLRTKSAILSIVLDYLYTGKHEEAKRALRKYWPTGFQEQIWKEAVSGYCSGLRAQMDLESSAPCGE